MIHCHLLAVPCGIVVFASVLVLHTPTTAAADSVQFTNRPPQVGQYGSHDVKFQLDLEVSLRQAGQKISSDQQQLVRDQHRQITVLQVADDRATQVRAHYAKARETVTRSKQSGVGRPQPIEGKTYLVERRGKELVITTEDGDAVAEEERVLVAASMDSVGRPNLLGKFLHGKSVAIGQTLKLPNEMASDLLGLRETGGEAQKVELTLRGVRQEADRRVADFAMLVVVKPDKATALDIQGDIQLDVDTCQVAAANFVGPVTIEETYGPEGHTFQMRSDGTMTVAMRSHYGNR